MPIFGVLAARSVKLHSIKKKEGRFGCLEDELPFIEQVSVAAGQ